MRSLEQGVRSLIWVPVLLFLGLVLGLLAAMAWGIFHDKVEYATVTFVALGFFGALFHFARAARRLTRPCPGRPIGPEWARLSLRWLGPLTAIAVALCPAGQLIAGNSDPAATLCIRAAWQLLSLASLSTTLIMLRAIEQRTASGQDSRFRYWYAWTIVGAVGTIWLVGEWWVPYYQHQLGSASQGQWGGVVLIPAVFLQVGVYMRALESVSSEWKVAHYEQTAP